MVTCICFVLVNSSINNDNIGRVFCFSNYKGRRFCKKFSILSNLQLQIILERLNRLWLSVKAFAFLLPIQVKSI
jgi:hypothetical protein